MMNWFRSPKLYPYFVVAMASILLIMVINTTGEPVANTVPLLLFMSAMLSMIFGAVEIGLSYIGRYEGQEAVYRGLSRAISAFALAMCFMLLLGAYEVGRA